MLIATITALVILALLSLFQITLILGAPLGHFAWGGQHRVLPSKLRVCSVVSIVTYIVFAVFIASKSGLSELITNDSLLGVVLWIMTGYMLLGVAMNAISRSKPERYTMTPVALLLAICLAITAGS